jgi:hypothetical protein
MNLSRSCVSRGCAFQRFDNQSFRSSISSVAMMAANDGAMRVFA